MARRWLQAASTRVGEGEREGGNHFVVFHDGVNGPYHYSRICLRAFSSTGRRLPYKAHYFLVGRPRGDYAPLMAGVLGKGLALRTALETLMTTESNCSVTAMATAFKKMSLDLQDHKEFIVQQVEDFALSGGGHNICLPPQKKIPSRGSG